ncbi:AMP-binding protein [Gordonia amarae]|uniref:AMP-binding protein n=2 Tax=Gordonia amarae TaxID=36821 RepID=A0A857KWH4_9ACTN|nr:AMP-binding protein [Gordonia amarae]MCS3878214.1 fatty-acyl-CoA synthase [Gordonia amarae]QHN16880.1 AMP-binding protein [Gordonia amarae]QHN21405.1 AMP-binding protein [Gordonia amarae]QHN30256.1 AMP-binding protein [Gordonia amarae]QHN39032.1 AMP-binding protein [Gordonia amarae]
MYPPTIAGPHPDRIAYILAPSGADSPHPGPGASAGQVTYAELDAESNRLAHYWREAGVKPGDSVVIVMENNIWWPVVTAAGMRSGVYVTPVNWHLTAPELAVLLDEAKPAAIVTSTRLTDTVLAAVDAYLRGPDGPDGPPERAPDLLCTDLLCPDPTTPTGDRYTPWAGVRTDWPATPVEGELLGARVLFSGGTTGRPKRFAQPLRGIHPADAPVRHSDLTAKLGVDENTVLLLPAPNYHAAPFTFTLITLAAGGTVVCMDRFDAAAAMTAITAHGVTHSQWVPTMLVRLLRLPDRDRIELSPLHRTAFTSGAPCPPHLKAAIDDWWGPILHEYYGASEGYGHTYISPADARTHPGSVGKPLGNTRLHIIKDGVELPAGEDGTVCFESIGDSTAAYKEMGDIGHLDDDGFLYLVGRAGYMIISGGVNIYPEEIEAALSEHPAVADAAVIGVPDPEFGESVKAIVEPAPGHEVTADELITHCRSRIAGYKVPRIVQIVDDLPRLPTGKLNKPTLIERFGAAVATP